MQTKRKPSAARPMSHGVEALIDITVACIYRGVVRTGTVNTKLPHGVDAVAWFEPGPSLEGGEKALAHVVEISTRCVPSVSVCVGPTCRVTYLKEKASAPTLT